MRYDIGDTVDGHFNPIIVFGSYIASFIGCELTVELLHRRGTGLHNLRSWCDTLLCAISLGLVGIWCMHFIGNRAIILGHGDARIQLVYSPGFSTLSVFLPITGLSIAFTAAEYPLRSPTLQWVALICTGIFAGLSIVGMHYMGNFGVSNYRLEYKPQYLAGSIIIAIGDCLAVLILFYTLREKWISDWRKRTACALFLAGGVSAMHFTASTHCIYRLRSWSGDAARYSRNVQVAAAGGLCGVAVIVIICVILSSRHRNRILKRSSQKVMLACAMFDEEGRILVTTEGVLPAREITDKFRPRTFDEDLDQAHPVFQWMFRISHNWSAVSELVHEMKSHLEANDGDHDSKASNSSSKKSKEPETAHEYSIIFRERFCVAAASLASSMHLPLEKAGILYDSIIDTGTTKPDYKDKKRSTVESVQRERDLESAIEIRGFGRGQLLFLTRSLRSADADRLINAGFKFGSVQQIGRTIAESMQVPLSALENHISNLRTYSDMQSSLQKPGTWLSCFAIIPKPHNKGFDVAVKKHSHNQLPDVRLLAAAPLQWQITFFERMHDKTMPSCMAFLEDRHHRDSARSEQEQDLATAISQLINKLADQLPKTWLPTARFYGKPVPAHYSQSRSKAGVTTLYSFVVCPDLHTPIDACFNITRIPLSFFRVRHQCYHRSPHYFALVREVHQEFGPLLSRRSTKQIIKPKKTSINLSPQKPHVSGPRHDSITRLSMDDRTDAASESYESADKKHSFNDITPMVPTTPALERENFLGGILVNSETVVNSDSLSEFHQEVPNIGFSPSVQFAVGTSKPEDTFVDELCKYARATITAKAVH